MNQLSMWQMVIDLGLVTSILLMAFNAARGSRSQSLIPQVAELEARVKKLIGEAEAAASGVHDQLIRREQNIQRYLSDVDQKEKALSATTLESESLTKELSLLCEAARREATELSQAVSDIARRRIEEAYVAEQTRREPPRTRAFPSESDSDRRDERVQFSTRNQSRRASEWIDRDDSEARETVASEAERSPLQKLNDLYHAAEEMLKSGREVREVSARTKIPVEGVERLAQMIEIEREETVDKKRGGAFQPGSDSRLGVLGGSRRSPQAQ